MVDETNEVTGQASRAEVHAQGLRHRAVHIFVVNGKSEVLLQQRSMLKDVQPGKWGSSAAGHLDAGEDYEEAARRELGEELGIETEELPLKLVGEIAPSEENGWEFIRLFVTVHSGVVRFPANEVAAVEWMEQDVLSDWLQKRPEDFSGGFRQCWDLLKASSES